jgi:hypothetical protein
MPDNKFWKLSKLIENRGRNISAVLQGGHLLTTEQEKADVIADSFRLAHNLTVDMASIHDPVVDGFVSGLTAEPCLNADCNTYTRPSEIASIVCHLKNGKAPGLNGVNNKHLKQLPGKALIFLTNIFNNFLKLCYFLKCWRHSKDIFSVSFTLI